MSGEFEFERDAVINARTGENLVSSPVDLKTMLAIKEQISAQNKPLPYMNGADMSPDTWNILKMCCSYAISSAGDHFLFSGQRLEAIEIHFVDGMKLGEIRECQCRRKKN